VYISCIFSWNRGKALGIAKFYESLGCEVVVGGYGIGFEFKLQDEIEHLMPDYDLYGVDFSMGFTSRGCIRNCPWCLIPKAEGPIRYHAPISEFHHPKHNKIILLDNNFLASPKWKENLFYIIERGLMVNFHQGLDIRLINDYKANLLAHTLFCTHTFQDRRLHFAFDEIGYEKAVRRGVETLKSHGIRPRLLTFYFLCGYNSTFEDDYYRYQVLRELGVDPFCMVYRPPHPKEHDYPTPLPLLKKFARWVNKPWIRKTTPDFRDYKRLTEKERKFLDSFYMHKAEK